MPPLAGFETPAMDPARPTSSAPSPAGLERPSPGGARWVDVPLDGSRHVQPPPPVPRQAPARRQGPEGQVAGLCGRAGHPPSAPGSISPGFGSIPGRPEEESGRPPSVLSSEASDEHLRPGSNSSPATSSLELTLEVGADATQCHLLHCILFDESVREGICNPNKEHGCILGLLREPKWGHLKELHRAIKLCEPALVAGDPIISSLGKAQKSSVFRSSTRACAAFLENKDQISYARVLFSGMHYDLPPWSISILPDCKTTVFNTARVRL